MFRINQYHWPLLIDDIPPLLAPGVVAATSDDDSDEEGEEDGNETLANNVIAYDDGDVLNALIAYQNQPQGAGLGEDGGLRDDESEMLFYSNTLEALTRICIRGGVMENSENVHLFLEQKITEALQEYNKRHCGYLMSQVASMGLAGDSLMQAIRRSEWISIEKTHDMTYEIRCDLQEFGVFFVEVETREYNLGSPDSLSHKLCHQISCRLIYDHLHSTRCTHPKNICLKQCNIGNVLNWAVAAEWKTGELEIPASVHSQLVATMYWLFWTRALF